MSKLIKYAGIGSLSILLGVISAPIYAKKGGGPSSIIKEQKEYKYPGPKEKNGDLYDHGPKKSLPDVSILKKEKFSDQDKEIISNFFTQHPFHSTGLPPGIAKNLVRGKPLPPGIAKVFLPQDLVNSLGFNPDYEYLMAGKDILLVNKSNQIIMDILYDILH